MKQTDAEAGGRRSLLSWASRIASATAALLLLMGSGAKAGHLETFDLSGDLNTFFGAPVAFTGTVNLDFTNDFADDTVKSLQITVQGHPVFSLDPSLVLSASTTGTIRVSDSADDMLTLLFDTSSPGAWTGFNTGKIFFGDVVFGGLTGSLLGAGGVLTRTSGAAIIDPPPTVIIDPPPPPTATVPELPTWAMMLVGLAGLGLAAKGRRALASLGGRA
ncbi:MAG: hypothetical protein WA397_23000 [Roseiarcus sp.]